MGVSCDDARTCVRCRRCPITAYVPSGPFESHPETLCLLPLPLPLTDSEAGTPSPGSSKRDGIGA